MQEDYDFDWNLARRSKSRISLFSAHSSPSSKAGPGTVFNLKIFDHRHVSHCPRSTKNNEDVKN